MITDNFPDFIGFKCFCIDDEGRRAYIETPFYFEDGRGGPIYATLEDSSEITFDDGGDVMLHFRAKCLIYSYKEPILAVIEATVKKNSVSFADRQMLKVSGPLEDSDKLFANFLGMMLDIRNWELKFLESLETEAHAE